MNIVKCARENEQLAEWLEELKAYQDKNKMVVRIDVENVDNFKYKIDELSKYAESQYNKAIDDFVEYIWETTSSSDIEWITRDYELYDESGNLCIIATSKWAIVDIKNGHFKFS